MSSRIAWTYAFIYNLDLKTYVFQTKITHGRYNTDMYSIITASFKKHLCIRIFHVFLQGFGNDLIGDILPVLVNSFFCSNFEKIILNFNGYCARFNSLKNSIPVLQRYCFLSPSSNLKYLICTNLPWHSPVAPISASSP